MSISKKKKIAFIFAIILICFVLFAGYKAYRQLKSTVLPGYLALSENTIISLEFKDYQAVIAEFSESNHIWTALRQSGSIDTFGLLLSKFDSVVNSEKNLAEILGNSKIYIALQKSANKNNILFVAEMPRGNHETVIENFIRKVNGDKSIVLEENYSNSRIVTANIPSLNKMFGYTVHKGLFIGSFDKTLVKQAVLEANKKKHFFEMPVLAKLRLTGGKKVNANLYFNYKLLSGIAAVNTHHDFMSQVAGLAEFAGYAGLDMVMTEDEILLNGYTIPNDSLNEYLNSFKQEPQQVRVTEILPASTFVLMDIGIADYPAWSNNFYDFHENSQVSSKTAKLRQKIENQYGIDFSEVFASLVGNEAALAMVKYDEFTVQDQKIAVLHCKSIKDAETVMDSLSNLVAIKTNSNPFLIRFDDYLIRSIPVDGLLQSQLGSFFESFSKNYYVPVKDYLVFAENPDILVRMINDYYNHLTLHENKRFKGFSNNISDKSNILLYLANNGDFTYLDRYVSKNLKKGLDKNKSIPENIDAVAIQYSYLNKIFYTNLYLKYTGENKSEQLADHECELKAEMAGIPSIVSNPGTGKQAIMVFDRQNTLYFIDDNGQIMWQKNLPEPSLSQVFEVEYSPAGNTGYAFNTASALYLIDEKGADVSGFPVPFKSRASNGIAIFDYEKNKDYRIVFAAEDNRIYNYNVRGELIQGWEKIKTNSTVKRPVKHIVSSGKDYMIVREESGNILVTNRRGENRISIPSTLISAKGTNFYPNRTNSKGPVIFTDNKGKLTYIELSGKYSFTDFGDFSPDHYFFYEDFDLDGSDDFIYLDKNKFSVFTRMKEVIFTHDFSFNLTVPPQLIIDGKKALIACIDPLKGNVILLSNQGLMFPGRNFRGTIQPGISDLKKNGTKYLVTGESNKVYIYQLD